MAISTPFNLTPNQFKRAGAKIFDSLGINSLGFALQKIIFGPFIRAVNYHEIRTEKAGLFEDHLRYYSEKYCSVDLAKLEEFLKTGVWDDPKPGLILSFDDGHRSHCEIAAPLMEKYGFTGWFFVPIRLMNIGDAEGARDSRSNALTGEQLKYLDAHHVVGSHTQTHCRLRGDVPPDLLEAEIVGSQRDMEEFLGHSVTTFCWVGGEEESYSRQAADLIKSAYQHSFMTNSAVISASENPQQLQRTNIEAGNSLPLLRFQLSGLMDLYYFNKRKRVNRLTA